MNGTADICSGERSASSVRGGLGFCNGPSGGSSWTNNREAQRRLSRCSMSSCTAHGAGVESLRFASGSNLLARFGCSRSSTGNGAALFVENGRRLAGCRRPPLSTVEFLNGARLKSVPQAVSQRRSVGPDPAFDPVRSLQPVSKPVLWPVGSPRRSFSISSRPARASRGNTGRVSPRSPRSPGVCPGEPRPCPAPPPAASAHPSTAPDTTGTSPPPR